MGKFTQGRTANHSNEKYNLGGEFVGGRSGVPITLLVDLEADMSAMTKKFSKEFHQSQNTGINGPSKRTYLL